MGSMYATKVMGIKEPRVALLNIGKESEKGSQLTKKHTNFFQKNLT